MMKTTWWLVDAWARYLVPTLVTHMLVTVKICFIYFLRMILNYLRLENDVNLIVLNFYGWQKHYINGDAIERKRPSKNN